MLQSIPDLLSGERRLRSRPSLFLAAVLGLAPAFGAAPLAAAPDVIPPRAVSQPPPEWPAEALPELHDVLVPVILNVSTEGAVVSVEVEGSVSPEYDAAAIAAARRWTFEPALREGRPVAAKIRALVRFVAPPPEPASKPESARPDAPKSGAPEAPPAAPRGALPPQENVATHPAGAPPDEVVVIGHARPPSRGASDFQVEVGALRRVPRKNASELLKLAPGFFLTTEGGEGHPERVYLRGFDAREGQDIEISVDRVPVNESGNLHGNGYADTHFLIPELVLSLRVLEGPFDPRQGNYAVAGSADFELGLAKRGLTAKYSRGSFNTERLLLTWGPPDESLHTFGGAEIQRTDGFGRNRDSRRAAAMGQYEGALGPNASFRLGAAAHATEFHSAGLVREDDVEAGRVGFYDTYDPRQGGNGSRFQASAELESRTGNVILNQQVFAIRRGMRLRENFTGFLLDTQEAQQSLHAQRGDLFDLAVSETTLGARGFARSHAPALGQRQELEIGYFARADDVHSERQRVEAATGAPYRTDTDLTSRLADIGLYVDAAFRPLSWVTLRGGVRADFFAFDVLDACAVQSVSRPDPDDPPGDESCLDQQRFGAHREPNQRSSTASIETMPRASLLLGPVRHFVFSLSYGTGVRSIDPSYVTDDVETPFASIEALEGGVAYARSFGDLSVAARSIFFGTHVDRDLAFSETEGRSTLGGGTTRTGWSGSARLTHDLVDQSFNVTLVRSAFDDTHLLVPYVPGVVVRSDTTLSFELPVELEGRKLAASAALGASFVGRRALPYGQRSDTIFTLDLGSSLGWGPYELELEIMNLFDRRYRLAEYNFVSDFRSAPAPSLVPARHFVAGAPRSFLASLSANFGGL